jgi:hypothetical protein
MEKQNFWRKKIKPHLGLYLVSVVVLTAIVSGVIYENNQLYKGEIAQPLPPPAAEGQCSSDHACASGFNCIQTQCVQSAPLAQIGEQCLTTADCAQGLTCADNHICTQPVGTTVQGCQADTDCEFNETCKANVCTVKSCENDTDCAEGYKCEKSLVVCGTDVCDIGVCTHECTSNTDCTEGSICDSNKCAVKECDANSECANDERCKNNICKQIECSFDPDCDEGFECVDNFCIQKECTTDADCNVGFECKNNLCKEKAVRKVCIVPYLESYDDSSSFMDKFLDYDKFKSDWYMDGLEWFARWGILQGEEDPSDPDKRWFNPSSDLLKSTLYVTLMRTFEPYDNSKINYNNYDFSTPNTPDWSRPHVVRAIDEGYIDEDFNGYEEADRMYTMEQLVKVMNIDYEDLDTSDLDFKDIDELSNTDKKIVKALEGIVKGDDRGYLNPDQTLNRAEIFTMLYRAYENDMIENMPYDCESYEIE